MEFRSSYGIDHDNKSSPEEKMGLWMDVHGIGFSSSNTDSDSVHVATHNGLFKKTVNDDNLTEWTQFGTDKSDFMGFAVNSDNQEIMYSSGHPQTGGNLGFRMSNDSGFTWENVSDVTTPNPIDFHTISMSTDPVIIYGASGMGDKIYFSSDEGINWNVISPPTGTRVVTLAVNQTDSDNIYASTTNGIFSSRDQGNNWIKLNNEFFNQPDTMVTGIEISSDGKTVFAFVAPNQSKGEFEGIIVKSIDGGSTWTETEGQIPGVVFVSKFGFDNNGKIYAVLTQDGIDTGVASSVYSSSDHGLTWSLEGTNNKSLAGL